MTRLIKTPLPAADGSATTGMHWSAWEVDAYAAFCTIKRPAPTDSAAGQELREKAIADFLTREYPEAVIGVSSWKPSPAHGFITLPRWVGAYLQTGRL